MARTKVKDFQSSDKTEDTQEVVAEEMSYEEMDTYYSLKYKAFETNVTTVNNNLLHIINVLNIVASSEADNKTTEVANEGIRKAIGLLKYEEEVE